MFSSSIRIRGRLAGLLVATVVLYALPGLSLAQALQPPTLLGTPSGAPTPPPTPPPTTATGDPPLSFNASTFANATSSGSVTLSSGGSLTDKSITANGPQASVQCNGSCTLTRVRVNSAEALRVTSGNVLIQNSYLEALGSGADHADVIQTYSPGSSGTITLRSTAIVAHTTAATAGLFVADNWKPNLIDIENVVFWGGPYGLRLHADGYNNAHLRMKNVCFVGPFGYGKMLIDGAVGGGGTSGWFIDEWTNVNDCTIQNGVLVRGNAISRPN